MISKTKAQRDQYLAAGEARGYAEAVDDIFALLEAGYSPALAKSAAQRTAELLGRNHKNAVDAAEQAKVDADTAAWDRKIARAKASVAREAANAVGATISMQEIGK